MLRHVDDLESRIAFAVAIHGDDGHAWVVVDVRNANGEITGTLKAEFHASGYCGHPGAQPAGWELIWGTQGYVHTVYTPGKTVANDHQHAPFRFDTTPAQDEAVAEAVQAAGGIDTDALPNGSAAPDNSYGTGTGDFETYRVHNWNCFSFANRMLEAAIGDQLHDTFRWWQLRDELNDYRDSSGGGGIDPGGERPGDGGTGGGGENENSAIALPDDLVVGGPP
jgi:hypothetical protein